jgi:hypothetical protein
MSHSVLTARPILKAAITSAVILSAGDVICQHLSSDFARDKDSLHSRTIESTCIENDADCVTKAASANAISISRSARYAWTGLTLHGPYFYFAYRWYVFLALGVMALTQYREFFGGKMLDFVRNVMIFVGKQA